MNYRAMLDTNIVSHALRFPSGRVADLMTAPGQAPICVSIIVALELHFGARKLGSAKLLEQVEGVLERIDILPQDGAVAETYATMRTTLERSGTPIGPHDTLIAAHALSLDLPLVTDNIREFSRVPNLRVENWLD